MTREIDPEHDDRQDAPTRDRVTEIASGLNAWRERVERRLKVAIGLVIVAVVIAIVAPTWLFIRTNHQAAANTAALCALRSNLQRQVDSSVAFLRTHPEGVPGLATAKEIRADISNRRSTIRTLSGLECS
jgi:uncharacterized membrane protein